MKISVMIATSLDGFIARKNGSLDWLMAATDSKSSEDHGFSEFFKTVDCMVMGRNSMEVVQSFIPEYGWNYERKRVVVLSTTLKKVPAPLEGKIELSSGDITAVVHQLSADGVTHVFVDGGKTIQSFLLRFALAWRSNMTTNSSDKHAKERLFVG